MCFSAEASFAAAAGLAAIGWASLRAAPTKHSLPFAAIPLLFAAQQGFEGLLWLEVSEAPWGKSDTPLGRAFLFFALFVWPAWVPGSLAFMEQDERRRRILIGFAAAGAALGGYLFGCSTLRASDACIAGDNLYYWVQIDTALKTPTLALYLVAVAAPLYVSSVRGTGHLGNLTVISFVGVGALYRAGFVSVWCFIAAVLSGVVALIVLARRGRRTAFPDVAERA